MYSVKGLILMITKTKRSLTIDYVTDVGSGFRPLLTTGLNFYPSLSLLRKNESEYKISL